MMVVAEEMAQDHEDQVAPVQTSTAFFEDEDWHTSTQAQGESMLEAEETTTEESEEDTTSGSWEAEEDNKSGSAEEEEAAMGAKHVNKEAANPETEAEKLMDDEGTQTLQRDEEEGELGDVTGR